MWRSIRSSCRRWAPTAADVSRQLRLVQTESAGGRTDLGGSEQPVRTLATVQTAQELAGLTLALLMAAICGWTRWPP